MQSLSPSHESFEISISFLQKGTKRTFFFLFVSVFVHYVSLAVSLFLTDVALCTIPSHFHQPQSLSTPTINPSFGILILVFFFVFVLRFFFTCTNLLIRMKLCQRLHLEIMKHSFQKKFLFHPSFNWWIHFDCLLVFYLPFHHTDTLAQKQMNMHTLTIFSKDVESELIVIWCFNQSSKQHNEPIIIQSTDLHVFKPADVLYESILIQKYYFACTSSSFSLYKIATGDLMWCMKFVEFETFMYSTKCVFEQRAHAFLCQLLTLPNTECLLFYLHCNFCVRQCVWYVSYFKTLNHSRLKPLVDRFSFLPETILDFFCHSPILQNANEESFSKFSRLQRSLCLDSTVYDRV